MSSNISLPNGSSNSTNPEKSDFYAAIFGSSVNAPSSEIATKTTEKTKLLPSEREQEEINYIMNDDVKSTSNVQIDDLLGAFQNLGLGKQAFPILNQLRKATIEALPETSLNSKLIKTSTRNLSTMKPDSALPVANSIEITDAFDFASIKQMLDTIEVNEKSTRKTAFEDTSPTNPLIAQILDQFETAVNVFSQKVRTKRMNRKKKRLMDLNRRKKTRGSAYNDRLEMKTQKRKKLKKRKEKLKGKF